MVIASANRIFTRIIGEYALKNLKAVERKKFHFDFGIRLKILFINGRVLTPDQY